MPKTPKPAAANGRPREDRIAADGGYSFPTNRFSPFAQADQSALAPPLVQGFVGWPSELTTEISAAPSRRVAAALISLSQDAIDALAEDRRERLLEAIQDIIAELPADDSQSPWPDCRSSRADPSPAAQRKHSHG
jgi:hypothetical protein